MVNRSRAIALTSVTVLSAALLCATVPIIGGGVHASAVTTEAGWALSPKHPGVGGEVSRAGVTITRPLES